MSISTLAVAVLALQLSGSPHGPPPAPPPASPAWDDDSGDLARLARLAARFDLAVIRRDLQQLKLVEARVRDEIAAEQEEARRERRRGTDRRISALERARRVFADARERTDGKSLDRKRSALAEVSQAAWSELVGVAGGQASWRAERDERRDREREREWAREWERDHGEGSDQERWGRDDGRREEYGSRDEREAWRPGPPPPTPARTVQPMRPERFDGLLRAVQQESRGETRLRIVDTALAAPDAWVSVEQVGRLLAQFGFSQEKLELMRRVRSRIADPEESYRLYDRFTFDADKEELRRILAQP